VKRKSVNRRDGSGMQKGTETLGKVVRFRGAKSKISSKIAKGASYLLAIDEQFGINGYFFA